MQLVSTILLVLASVGRSSSPFLSARGKQASKQEEEAHILVLRLHTR